MRKLPIEESVSRLEMTPSPDAWAEFLGSDGCPSLGKSSSRPFEAYLGPSICSSAEDELLNGREFVRDCASLLELFVDATLALLFRRESAAAIASLMTRLF